jgi:hypothetical protein
MLLKEKKVGSNKDYSIKIEFHVSIRGFSHKGVQLTLTIFALAHVSVSGHSAHVHCER